MQGLCVTPSSVESEKASVDESATNFMGVNETDGWAVRRRFGEQLSGRGIEVGPGHVPFPVSTVAEVQFVDRWEPYFNSNLFPELGAEPGFPKPDILVNLDETRLEGIASCSQEFVIASHVIEHLANPIAFLVEVHRVLKQDGNFVLLVPDRHSTFDRGRPPTPLEHIVKELEQDVRYVDDQHILDFLNHTSGSLHGRDDQSASRVSPEYLELHRQRSVHVHCWDISEFKLVLDYCDNHLGVKWEFLDFMPPQAPGTNGDEFGWLLRKR